MLSYKDSDEIIRKYANEYNKSKIIDLMGIKLINNDVLGEKANCYIDSENKYTYYYSLQTKIEAVLSNLDWDCSTFIRKEFFEPNRKNMWWSGYYSRSTYYRLKK
jgi:hypothetical protein